METHLSRAEKLELIRSRPGGKDRLLSVLLDLQAAEPSHCIDEETAALVGAELGIAPARVYDAVSFYAMLSPALQARFTVEVCESAPCHFSHAGRAADLAERALGVRVGEDTPDGLFALRAVPCFGACDKAPAVKIDGHVYGPLDEAGLRAVLAQYKEAE